MLALDTMSSLTLMVLYLIIGAMIIVLSLLLILYLRDRRQEVGIYLSLGENRRNVMLQLIVEVVMITAVALAISLFVGNILAGYLGDNILLQNILAELEYEKYAFHNPAFRRGLLADLTANTIEDGYNISLSLRGILVFFGVGIGTTLMATVLPILYITRMNPKKIMM